MLDLYERRWKGQQLRWKELAISTDEKTSIQARLRIHLTTATALGASTCVHHECASCSALACLAHWTSHRAKVFGR